MTRIVPVGLGARAYDVVIGAGLLARAEETLVPVLPRKRTVIVTDDHLDTDYACPLQAALTAAGVKTGLVVLPAGEATKSFQGLERLLDALLAEGLDRKDRIIALGGGVIGDLAGLAAALYMRGIDFIQVPTTLLAQVDSSVGGKTAIDTPRGKNLVGAFHQPRLVLADLDTLATLPLRELRAGYAEVAKYGLLGDADFFAWLEAHGADVLARDPAALAHAVARSVEMKAEIVAEDEKEAGRRALLNLGHTFGHAIEVEAGFGDLLVHGEAVALGCALAFRYAARLSMAPAADAERVEAHFRAAGLPTRLSDLASLSLKADTLVAHMALDKKAEGGAVTLVLPRRIGETVVVKNADPAELIAFLRQEGGA